MFRRQLAFLVVAIGFSAIAIEDASAWYLPSTGRFLSRDPIGFEGSEWNLYEYGNSNPLKNLDAFGLSASTPGMLNVSENAYDKSAYPGCCSTGITASYTPTAKDKAELSEIAFSRTAKTCQTHFPLTGFCLPSNNFWKDDSDASSSTNWKDTSPFLTPSIVDTPGTGPNAGTRSAVGGCPRLSSLNSLNQQFEVCVWGKVKGSGKLRFIGCTSYSFNCQMYYKLNGCECDVSCSKQLVGKGQHKPGKAKNTGYNNSPF